jgi:Uma2 family endonuclease
MILHLPTTSNRLDFTSAGLRLTPAEFCAHEDWDENYRYELIHGVLVVAPPPSDEEVGASDYLGHLLWSYKEGPHGAALDATFFERELVIGDSVRRVDRAIWAGLGRYPNSQVDLPTILIEFLSPGKLAFIRDYEDKRDEYLRLGVKEYWVIDRFSRQMTVFTGEPGQLTVKTITESESYRTALLPGFELPLARLLAVADRSTAAKQQTTNNEP